MSGTAARDLEWIRKHVPEDTEAQPYRVRVWHDEDGWCACVGMALVRGSGMDLDSVCADLRREVERGEHVWSNRPIPPLDDDANRPAETVGVPS